MYSQIPHLQCQIHILDSNQSDTLKKPVTIASENCLHELAYQHLTILC